MTNYRLTFMEDGQKQTFTLKMEDGCGCNRLWLMTVIDSNGTQKGSEEVIIYSTFYS